MDGDPDPQTYTLTRSFRVFRSIEIRGWTVGSVTGEGLHLRVTCANAWCAQWSIFDATTCDPSERLGQLEARMRCSRCGGREGRFEAWTGPQPKASDAGAAVWRFR